MSISRKTVFTLIGPLLFLLMLSINPPKGLSDQSWILIALICWIVIWWATEAVPLAVTALLPIPLMPALGILEQKQVTSAYAHPLIFLFMGGFIISIAMQRWNLHKRIALHIILFFGGQPKQTIAGFMTATALLSMWISNTATTIMMFTVASSVIHIYSQNISAPNAQRQFAVALLLGVAYSASIGGVATLIGTPPNALLAAYLADHHQITIDFTTWMKLGVPLALIMLPVTWFILIRWVSSVNTFTNEKTLPVNSAPFIKQEIVELGKPTREEIIILIIFGLTAFLWISRKLIVNIIDFPITDTSIAVAAAITLFLFPAKGNQRLLEWSNIKDMPWGILLLFGGGLAIAAAFKSTGLAVAIGDAVTELNAIHLSIFTLVLITSIVFLTEITSNTATTATFLPILGAVAVGLSINPIMLTVPAAIAASMAFMMPVATPPNAIVFSHEEMRISDMMKAGIVLNVIAIGVIYLLLMALMPIVF